MSKSAIYFNAAASELYICTVIYIILRKLKNRNMCHLKHISNKLVLELFRTDTFLLYTLQKQTNKNIKLWANIIHSAFRVEAVYRKLACYSVLFSLYAYLNQSRFNHSFLVPVAQCAYSSIQTLKHKETYSIELHTGRLL